MKSLSPKQQLFVEEYLIDQNATQAYLRAGYKVSEKVAGINAHNTLKNPKIAAELNRRLATKFRKLELTTDNVLQEIAKLAFSNIASFIKINEDGMPEFNLKAVSVDQFAAIAELKFDEVYENRGETVDRIRNVRIKFHDKLRGLEMIGRYFKLFSENHQRVNEEALKILRAVRAGEMSVEDASYDFAILGLPLPEVLRLKLEKVEATSEGNSSPPTTEEILRRAEQMLANIGIQKTLFVPERQQLVAELKDKQSNGNAFAPGDFVGED